MTCSCLSFFTLTLACLDIDREYRTMTSVRYVDFDTYALNANKEGSGKETASDEAVRALAL